MKMEDMKLNMIIFGLSLLTIVRAAPSLDNYNKQWEDFKQMYKREYNRTGEGARRLIFDRNVKIILNHNINADSKKYSYRLGINKFTDWTAEEFSRFNGFKPLAEMTRKGSPFLPPTNGNYPAEVDWRREGWVTEVKNQGDFCRSCWAFSATGSLEGQHKKKTGNLVSLSEQNLIDCSASYGNNGCQGGYYTMAFEYVRDNNGIDTEESYPYEAKIGKCRFNTESVGATDNGPRTLPKNDEKALQAAVAGVGPISVAIDASGNFRQYQSGVYDPEYCSSTELDHAVLVVGYGTEEGKDYWLIKNSWGENWGEDGYVKMVRNSGNKCGVATEPAFPLM